MISRATHFEDLKLDGSDSHADLAVVLDTVKYELWGTEGWLKMFRHKPTHRKVEEWKAKQQEYLAVRCAIANQRIQSRKVK